MVRFTVSGVSGMGDVPDKLSLSFVFIDILALFAQKHFSTIGFKPQPLHSRMAQTPMCRVCDVPKGQVRAIGTIPPNCAFAASQTFKGNVWASPFLVANVCDVNKLEFRLHGTHLCAQFRFVLSSFCKAILCFQ